MSPGRFEFEKEIFSISGKEYNLRVTKNPDKSLKGQHWKVELRKVTVNYVGKRILSEDLLYPDKPCDTGGDSISRERFAGFFYPYEDQRILVNGIPMIEWNAFYPTKMIRKFLVDGFVVVLKSGKIEFSENDKTSILLFEINIDFKNSTNY